MKDKLATNLSTGKKRVIHVHIHIGGKSRPSKLQRTLETIMATQSELVTTLFNVTEQITKIGNETLTLLDKIDELTSVVAAGGNTTPEVDAAVSALVAQAAVVDSLVPDTTG